MRALAPLLLMAALGARAQDGPKARAIAQAGALAAAVTDADRDAASQALKASLIELLSAPDALGLPLDDLPLSRVDAPDGAFRLITWNVPQPDGQHRYEGLLLARQGKGQRLFELQDMTASIANPAYAETGPERWYGALYYEAVPVSKGGRTWYTLLGWKGYTASETRKVVEVLSFRGGKPRFGAPLFGTGRLKEQRLVFAFAFSTSMMLRHEPGKARIVMDHLSPIRPDLQGSAALMGPDMSFDALVWEKGRWALQRDVDLRDPKRDSRPYKAPPPRP